MPTANEPPATPMNRPSTRYCQYSVAYDSIQVGTTTEIICRKYTIRPP